MSFNEANRAFLAFGGLTESDVKIVIAPSSTAAWGHVIEGTGESFNITPEAPKAKELEASRHGIYWIPTPRSDIAGWKRLLEIAPFAGPFTPQIGAGISKDIPIELSGQPYLVIAYSNLPEEYAYTWTKGVWKGWDLWSDKHPSFKLYWTNDICTDYKRLCYPYHDGTVRFLKEIGVWTSAMEEWQQKQVKIEARRIAAWGEAKQAAEKQKIKVGTPEFAEFWIKWQKERDLVSYPAIR